MNVHKNARLTPRGRLLMIERVVGQGWSVSRSAQASGVSGRTCRRWRSPVIRYERERPGELIHLDIKSLGKIDGIGHRITGHHQGHHRARGIGWEHLYVAIDDASRLAYTEILPSLDKEDATAFLQRAMAGSPASASPSNG
jgi:hypothetical protein